MSDVCPLKDGLHLWLWPGGHARGMNQSEGWLTARTQAARAVRLGAAGVIPQASLYAPAWLAGKDPGDTLTRAEIFHQAGLQVTAGLGIDGSGATRLAVANAWRAALDIPDACVMIDEESEIKWESAPGRTLAAGIVDDVIRAHADAPARSVFCPWWHPRVHSAAPDREFYRACRFLFTQDYGAKGCDAKEDHTLDFLAVARAEYPPRGIPAEAVKLAFQLYAHSVPNASRIVFSGERVMCAWDVEEMDENMRRVLMARVYLRDRGFPLDQNGVKIWQASAGLTADGVIGPLSLAKMGL